MQMANIQETRNFCFSVSICNPAPVASVPEQILRRTDVPYFYKTFQEPRHAVQEPAVTMEAALELNDEDPPSSPKKG